MYYMYQDSYAAHYLQLQRIREAMAIIWLRYQSKKHWKCKYRTMMLKQICKNEK